MPVTRCVNSRSASGSTSSVIWVLDVGEWLDLLQLSFSQMQNDLLLVGIWEIETCIIVVSNCNYKQNFQIVLTNRNPRNSLSST